MIVSDPEPRLTVVDGGGSVRVWLSDTCSVLVQTPLEAHAVADTFRRAAQHLDERARLVANRADRDAAVLTNASFEKQDRTWPGGTLAPAFSQSRVVHIPVSDGDVA